MQVPVPDDGEGQVLLCVQVQRVTHDVRTFVFEAEAAGLGRHEPGQYLVLGVESGGGTVERCYTISTTTDVVLDA